jgi:hypothetical protein
MTAMHGRPRQGFHSLTPGIVIAEAAGLVSFLREVFDAEGEYAADRLTEMGIASRPAESG